MTLYLIGVDHRDRIDGPARLSALYDKLKPRAILDERSEDHQRKNEDLCRYLLDGLNRLSDDRNGIIRIMTLFQYAAFPFPSQDNETYARSNGIPFYFAGIPDPRNEDTSGLEQIANDILVLVERTAGKIDPHIPRILEVFSAMLEDPPSGEYLERAWRYYLENENRLVNEIYILRHRLSGLTGRRDEHMERLVRELYDPDGGIAFPLGMVHAQDSFTKSTLYSRIKDLSSERLLL